MSHEYEIKELIKKAKEIGADYINCHNDISCLKIAIFNRERELKKIKQSQNKSISL